MDYIAKAGAKKGDRRQRNERSVCRRGFVRKAGSPERNDRGCGLAVMMLQATGSRVLKGHRRI